MGTRGPRLAAFGYFGMGNLGNEASLAALLARVRERPTRRRADLLRVRRGRREPRALLPATRLMTYRPACTGFGQRSPRR